MIKKFFNFVKNNIFLFFAIYWFAEFTIGFIKFNPSSLDETTRKITTLKLGLDLVWTLVFILEHTFYKLIRLTNERIDCVNKRIDIICDAITEAVNAVREEKNEDENGKENKTC